MRCGHLTFDSDSGVIAGPNQVFQPHKAVSIPVVTFKEASARNFGCGFQFSQR